MSESEQHRELVRKMASNVASRYPHAKIDVDIQKHPGEAVPGPIDGYRPDVYANCRKTCTTIICEAKTGGDLENRHTDRQFHAFMNHLAREGAGIFICGVPGEASDLARSVLRFCYLDCALNGLIVELFDGLDYWTLTNAKSGTWHLN